MAHPGAADTQAVRAASFIDPKGVLRAMVYYPMSNGRSINEFVRRLQAMQTSGKNGVATSEGWTPGSSERSRAAVQVTDANVAAMFNADQPMEAIHGHA